MITVSLLGYAVANNFISMVLLRVFHGLGSVFFWVSALTFSSLTASGMKRDEVIRKYTLAVAMGMMSGPVISTFCIFALSMRDTFIFASTLACLSMIPAIFLVRKTPFKPADFLRRKQSFVIPGRVLSNRVFQSNLFAYFAVSFAFGVMLTYAPIYAREAFSFADEQVTLLFFGYYLAMTGVRFGIGEFIKLLGKSMISALGLFGAVCMLWIMSISSLPAFFATAFCLYGLSMGVVFPIGAMRIADTLNRSDLVLANSFYLLGWDLGCTLAPILLSFVAVQLGIPYALATSAILPLSAILIMTYRANS